MKYIKKIYLIILLNVLFFPPTVLASSEAFDNMKTVASGQGGTQGFDTNTTTSIYTIVANIVEAFLALLGTIFLILIVWAGYAWMTAGGDEQKLEKAKNTIYRAIIGLIITAAAWAITAFVFTRISGVGGSGGPYAG